MATIKTVKVTVAPTLTGDTVASYNVYSSIPSAGTLLGTLSIAEAAAGKDFSLSDGATHSITVKAVWTNAGETTTVGSNAVSVTTASSSFGITTGASSAMHCLYNPGAADWSVDMTLQDIISDNASAPGSMLFATSGRSTVTYEGSIDCRINDEGAGAWGVLLSTRDVGGTVKTTATYTVVDGDNIKVTRVGTSLTLFINNVSQEVLTIDATWSWAASSISFANNDATPTTSSLGALFSTLTIDGDDLLPTTQSSGTPITTGAIDLNLVSGTYTAL